MTVFDADVFASQVMAQVHRGHTLEDTVREATQATLLQLAWLYESLAVDNRGGSFRACAGIARSLAGEP